MPARKAIMVKLVGDGPPSVLWYPRLWLWKNWAITSMGEFILFSRNGRDHWNILELNTIWNWTNWTQAQVLCFALFTYGPVLLTCENCNLIFCMLLENWIKVHQKKKTKKKSQNTTNISKKSLLDTVSVQLQKYKFLSFFYYKRVLIQKVMATC